MRRIMWIVDTLLGLWAISGTASAALVGTHSVYFERHWTGAGPVAEVDLYPFWTDGLQAGPKFEPWGRIKLAGSSPGQDVCTMDDATTGFADVVALLTNGTDDYLGVEDYFNVPLDQRKEAVALMGEGFNGIDFAGTVIDRITLHCTAFESGYENGNGAYLIFGYTMVYSGTVPEPGSLSLLVLGGMALLIHRRCL